MTTKGYNHADIELQGFTVMARGEFYRVIKATPTVWWVRGPGTYYRLEASPMQLTYMYQYAQWRILVGDLVDAIKAMTVLLENSEILPYPLELNVEALTADIEYGLDHLQMKSKAEWEKLIVSDLAGYTARREQAQREATDGHSNKAN